MTKPTKTENAAEETDGARWCDGEADMIDRAFTEARLPLAHECAQHPEIDAGDK